MANTKTSTCYLCKRDLNDHEDMQPGKLIEEGDLPHMKKLKSTAKLKDKMKLCNDCYPKVFPGAFIRLTVPDVPPGL